MQLTLTSKIKEARDIWSFFFSKPGKRFNHLPGQYLYYTLPKLDFEDPRGAVRQFTIASSPTEKNSIQLTTRIREQSGFKKTLDKLPFGSIINAEGPNGSFIMNDKLQGQQLMFAGGIGITPFRSFIKYNIDNRLKIPVFLVYSNSDADFVYKNEFDQWQEAHDFLKVHYHNSGITGHLEINKIKKIVKDWKLKSSNINTWVVGPPPFVSAIGGNLEQMNIEDDKIHTEKFTGY